jgi:RND superfamily putative drug exporter
MLERIARFCFRRRRAVALVWVAVIFVLGALSGAAGGKFKTEFRLPASESKRGFDIMNRDFPGGAGGFAVGTVVFRADDVNAPAVKTAMTTMFDAVGKVEGLRVLSPYSAEAQGQVAVAGPDAGKIAYANVTIPDTFGQADLLRVAKKVTSLIPSQPGLQVELGGQAFAKFEPPSSETLGLAFAIVILLLAFGSVLAMGLPVGDALAGIFLGTIIVTLLSHVIKMPDFTTLIGGMIGLGVGIDYALFIVTRYREALHRGQAPEDATVTALGTAGRAVLFAGITVVISLLGMILMGLSFVRGLAIGASVTVAATLLASITLLPALLGFAKHRIEVTRVRAIVAIGLAAVGLFFVGLKMPAVGGALFVLAILVMVAGFFVPALKRELPPRKVKPLDQTFWYRWGHYIQRRPWPSLLVGLVILGALALPVFSLRLGNSDDGNFPADTTTRKAYDLLSQGFGPGFNGPLLVVTARHPASAPMARLRNGSSSRRRLPRTPPPPSSFIICETTCSRPRPARSPCPPR